MLKLRSRGNGTKRSLAMLLGVGALVLATQPVVRTAPPAAPPVTAPGLPFSKGFLVTGGYAVGSVDLVQHSGGNGFLSGTINMSGIPANADILAAYLYWQTIATNVSQVALPTFRGQQIESAREIAKVLDPSIAPCYSGGSSNNVYTMYAFRADILRLLPSKLDANGVHVLVNNSDLQANGQALSTVTLPDAGSGNQVPTTAGASLFVVYRDPVSPLTSISVYDGLSVQAPGTTTTHTFAGFLGAPANPTARMTQMVSSGASNNNERLYFNNTLLASNPFAGGGPSSDRVWNTVTYDVGSLMNLKTDSPDYGELVTTKIDHTSTSPYECLTWSAMIFSTTVRDADHDGLPDRLEDQSGLNSPDGNALPDLHGMLASSQHKDIFIEMGALKADQGHDAYSALGHNHMPTAAVLRLVGDAYKNAPIANLDGTSGIFPHFDVGASYSSLGPDFVPDAVTNGYIVPPAYANGGELINEVDDPSGQFPGYPGTVSWKIGFQVLRDAPENPDGSEMSAADMDHCNVTLDCRRRFDQNRMNFFHYVLYAHYRGKAKEPCVTGTADQQAACKATNPDYHVPSTASGIADLPGADALVTLGGWGHGFVGSDFVRASTTLHELGHTTWLTHGGSAVTITEPNCKPNYLSVMNYLFQLSGLRDEDGTPHVDYSATANGVINENTLGGDPLNPIHLQYRTAWFAPLKPGSLPFALGTAAATRYCNGAKFPDPLPAGWVDFARVDAYSATLAAIDWSAGLNAGPPQDVNFDGQLEASLAGFSDWSNLRLDQVGSRRNMGGFSLGIDMEFGVDVSGGTDLWGVDVSGGIEWGVDVSGGMDFGGNIDYSFGVDVSGGIDDPLFGVDVSGGVDLFGVDVSGGREVDREIARDLGNAPANNVKACVTGTPGCLQGSDPLHRVRITWKEPDVGTATSYSVYRVQGSTVSPSSTKTKVGGADVPAGQLSVVDPTELPTGVAFTYFVIVHFADGATSAPSNFSTITAVNDAPVGVADPFTFARNSSANPGAVLGNDTDADSRPLNQLTAVLVTGPTHAATAGFTFNANGTFTYTPVNGFTGTDTFTYRANDGTWAGPPSAAMSANSNLVTVTITVIKK